MDIQDVEKFIKGAEEIDRKRALIVRVLGTLISLLKNLGEICDRCGELILELELGPEFRSIKLLGTYYLRCGPVYGFSIESADGINKGFKDIPFGAVPMVYDKLPEIVDAVDQKFPQAGIAKHFEFFVQQAQEKQTD